MLIVLLKGILKYNQDNNSTMQQILRSFPETQQANSFTHKDFLIYYTAICTENFDLADFDHKDMCIL
jgi:hypothetical protein